MYSFSFITTFLAAEQMPRDIAPLPPAPQTPGAISWENCAPNDVATLACIPIIVKAVITWALFLSGIVALFFILFAAFKWITSNGDPKQVEGARNTLLYAIIGLVIILSSFFILNIIAGITSVECITSFGFDNCQ